MIRYQDRDRHAARTSRRRVAAVPRRALVPRTGAAPGAGRSRVLRPGYEAVFAPWETPLARRRDRVLVGPEARDPTSGNVRCPRRPRRERCVRHRGSPAARTRGAARAHRRARLPAIESRRVPRVAAEAPGTAAPLRWDHTPRGPEASAVPDRLRSRTVQDPLPRSREAAGTKVGAPGEGTAGRARDVVPGLRRGRLRVLPRRSPRALPPARVSRARLARGDDGLALQTRSRGRRAAAGEALFAGCGWEGGQDHQTVPLAFLVSSVALRARPGGIRARGGVPARDPAPVPVRVLDQDPSPARLSRPRGTTRLQAGCARAPPGGEPAVRTRSVRGEGPPAGRRRLAHPPIPRRTGGAFRIDRGAHERTCPGAHDLGPALTISVRRSRSRFRSSARGGAGSEGGNASLGGSGLDRRRSSRSRPRRGSRGLDPDVGPGPGLTVGSISSPCG